MGTEGSDRLRLRRRLSVSPATTPPTSFYKIILPSIMHDHRLRIPEEFAKKHGNDLSTSVTFTVPGGQIWHVGVEKTDKMLWFSKGWKEFAQKKSVSCGFFLVFNYEGNSKFNVLIFDLTATEIHNPRNTTDFSKASTRGKQCLVSNKGRRGGCDFVETFRRSVSRPVTVSLENKTLDECLVNQRTGKRCCNSMLQNLFEFAPEFALRINEQGRCISSLDSLRSNFHYLTRNKRCKMEDQGKIAELEDVTVSCGGRLKASEISNSQRSSVDESEKERWSLTKDVENLPAAIHINREDKEGQHHKTDSVSVQEATQRSKDGQQLKIKHEEEVELLGENNSGDVSMKRPVTIEEKKKAVNAAMMFKPKNPSFLKIMQPYNVYNSFFVYVPSGFAKRYLHSDSVRLQVSGGKQWTVRCIELNGTVQSLSRGWRRFAKDNHLGEGDVCVFELIQVEGVVLKVSIFHASEDARQTNLQKWELVD